MTTPDHITGLRKEVARLDAWGANLRDGIADRERELRRVERLRAVNIEILEEMRADARKSGRRRVTLDGIKNCDTQREVLRYVTEVNFGLAHLGEVAELVIDARMSKAEKHSVRSTLHHYVNDSGDFVHIGKSWVWLKEFGPAPTLEEVESTEAVGQEGDVEDEAAAPDSDDETDPRLGGEPVPEPAASGEMAA